MQQSGIAAQLMRHDISFVLLGEGKRRSFFSLVHVTSTVIPEKESIKCICPIGREIIPAFYPLVHVVSTDSPEKERINGICLIRREKLPLFFSLAAASSTGVHRVKRTKDSFVLLGGRDSIFIGRRPD